MGKRYTDTEKWNKRFIRGLQAPYKLLWLFITDECSAAGIWDVDLAAAQLKLGVKLKLHDALKNFESKIIEIDNGEKWFIPSFIEFQYNELSEINRAHTKIIQILKKFSLIDENLKVSKGLIKTHASPLQGDKDKVEVKATVKVEVKDKRGESEKISYPFESDVFMAWWDLWKLYKQKQYNFTYKTIITEQAALNDLVKISDGTQENMIELIEYAISKTWKGIYPKKEQNGTGNFNNTTDRYQQLRKNLSSEIGAIANSF